MIDWLLHYYHIIYHLLAIVYDSNISNYSLGRLVSKCKRMHRMKCCTPKIVNTLRPRQNGRQFPYDIFKCIFLNESVWISIKTSPINYIPPWVQIMAWRQPGAKPLSEPMMISLLTHICVTRLQWVNTEYERCVYVQARINVPDSSFNLLNVIRLAAPCPTVIAGMKFLLKFEVISWNYAIENKYFTATCNS